MNYNRHTGGVFVPKYERASANQHGERYAHKGAAVVGVGRLEASVGCAVDLKLLILLGDMLDVPVRYDFETHPQVAYLEVVSAKRLREAL